MTILFTTLIVKKVEDVLFSSIPNRDVFGAQTYERSLKAISDV